MSPAEFARITNNVIRAQGFEGFLPTACFPERREVRTLVGIPADVETRIAVLTWARGLARPNEVFLVAFKSSPSEFTVIRVDGEAEMEQVFDAAGA